MIDNLKTLIVFIRLGLIKTNFLKVKDYPELLDYEIPFRRKFRGLTQPFLYRFGRDWKQRRGIPYTTILEKERFWKGILGSEGFSYIWKERIFYFGADLRKSSRKIYKFYKGLKERGYLKC